MTLGKGLFSFSFPRLYFTTAAPTKIERYYKIYVWSAFLLKEKPGIESTPNKLHLKYFILKGMTNLECAYSVAELLYRKGI